MAQISGLWTTDDTTPEGHQQASYTQAHASTMWEIAAACSGKEGVAPNYGNNMSCTTPGVNAVNVNTGGAIVDGKWYKNDAVIALDVDDFPSPSGGTTRIDRIVLRASWAAYTVSVVVIQGTESGGTPVAPSITQTPGTTYDILLYQVLIDSGGNITLTSERTFAIAYVDNSTIEAPGQLRVKDDGITLAKMAANSVDSDQYVDGSIDLAHMSANSVDSAQYVDGSIDLEHMSANSVDSDQYVDGSIDLAHLSADCVDDTKVGNRVPQFYRRQGGSSTVWSTAGDTTQTPGAVRMQAGSRSASNAVDTVSFPTAFSYAPIVIAISADANIFHVMVTSTSTTGFTARLFDVDGIGATGTYFWIAIGPE